MFDDQFTVFGKSMDLHQQRLGTIANNVANADTPGYKAKRLEFEDSLRQAFDGGNANKLALEQSHQAHQGPGGSVADVSGEMATVSEGARVDGNTVNTQKELERLGETRLTYRIVSELTGRRAKGLADAITKPT
mgnify:CR=1 FL=1